MCAKCEMGKRKVMDAMTEDDKLTATNDLQEHLLAAKAEHQVTVNPTIKLDIYYCTSNICVCTRKLSQKKIHIIQLYNY